MTTAERTAAAAAIARAIEPLGLGLPPGAEGPLATWLALLARWRKRRAIAGPRTLGELAVEAVADSLMADGAAPRGGVLLDVGSGAGIPGMALAAVAPDRRVALVEPSAPRVALLRLAIAASGLANVEVRQARAEDLARDAEAGRIDRADAAVSRAFLPPDEWIPLALRLVRPGGVVVAMTAARWPGPDPATGATVVSRRDYRLPGRRPRSVWAVAAPPRPTGG